VCDRQQLRPVIVDDEDLDHAAPRSFASEF
jgi:hypothetical protein